MPVLSEERVIAYLGRCLELCRALVPLLGAQGTREVSGDVREKFDQLVADLEGERIKDSYLDTESWNWIWKGKQSYNHLQVYGRLAWINLQLFDLL
ncbi:MAG TPA: hypothetical protein DCM87_17460 [Planctomycetes bacterium]|jgi:hypothetical protein|nr:hypothetical protein [Planctomycetota bacterium]